MFSLARKTPPAEATNQDNMPRDGIGAPLLRAMLDQMPINVMLADPETATISFINQTSIETLSGLRDLLPNDVDPEAMNGVSIDVFHKNPLHQRTILKDPSRLPHRAKIKLGPETLDLKISPLRDEKASTSQPC